MNNLVDAINSHDVLETFKFLTLNRRQFVGDSIAYDLDIYKNDAVNYKDLIISTPLWGKNILSFNDFSKELSLKLLDYQGSQSFWDYEIESFLCDNGYDTSLYELSMSDYTYNFEDCHLDRNIHFTIFNYDDTYYVCLSVHFGADARVGFSDCVVFEVDDIDYFFNSMSITAYTESDDEDLSIWDLDNIASYNEESNEWYLNESGERVIIYSSANGY